MTRSNFFFLFLLLPLFAACSQPTHAQPAAQPAPKASFNTATVATRTLPTTLTLTGTLIANRESAVAADAAGKIALVPIERGSRVRRGAVLARIDLREAVLREEEARANVASARTRSTLARTQCERATRLFQMGAISKVEYDNQKSECEDAEISVDAAGVRQRLASKTLRDMVVTAPFDGVVAERFVNPGEYVRPDARVATLVELDPLRLELAVPEDVIARFGAGAEVRFKVAAFPNDTFVGRVRFVGAAVRRATRDLVIEAVVPNPGEHLRPGMFATAEVVLGEAVLPVVPLAAIKSDERAGKDRVFVIEKGQIEERLVQVGPALDGAVAIRDGVRAGERIVLDPSEGLHDGLRVE